MSQQKGKKHRSDFLDDDCGQSALQLAARGSAIIVELLRLSQHIPREFVHPEESEYAAIISDFSYFKATEAFEENISKSEVLLQRDEVFGNTHVEFLDRCFKLFRGVFGYVVELNRFVEEILDGMYVSHTIESILADIDGKQILCEIYHLYGVMLLLLDHRFGGKIREYILVSYIRYKGTSEPNMMDVTSLCRTTGYRCDSANGLPPNYPLSYFNRVPVDKKVVGTIIGRIRSDDIYQMSYNFPVPEHRSAALSLQGAVLYVLLFFKPEILQHEGPVMREIVDKHFADNWIINYYMGFTVDLMVAWREFPAARNAISGTVTLENIGYYMTRQRQSMSSVYDSIEEVLRQGVLTEQYVLDNIHSTLLPLIREANVVLRWFVLHTHRLDGRNFYHEKSRQIYEMIAGCVRDDDIIMLLLRTAQLEFTLRAMFANLLKQKRARWESSRQEGAMKMAKLSTFFSGKHVLSDDMCDPQLEAWFMEISQRIEGLEYANSTIASRKIQKLIKALENVQEFHQVDSNLQVIQFVQDTRFLLLQMIRYINIENKVLITIATVGDVSYAWESMAYYNNYVIAMQLKIKQKPDLAVQMRAVFMKLASLLELPCNRIDQGAQNDARLLVALESTSEYYSGELVAFARRVLHIIPTSIFSILRQVMDILTNHLHECPTKLARKEMKGQSQLNVRKALSTHTADIVKYASGILAMESTLVGIIQVDPHQLLEDGIRKELLQQITMELHNSLLFDAKKPPSAASFNEGLARLAQKLNGIRASFEYIQDYVNVHGLRIWLEEFSRIVNFNVEMECNAFLQKKLYPWESQYQSESIPIPYFEPTPGRSTYSFLGGISQHLIAITDPSHALFLKSYGAWFERNSLEEVVGSRTFASIGEAIGSMGLVALDRMLCFIIAKNLQQLLKTIRATLEPLEETVMNLAEELCSSSHDPRKLIEIYEKLMKLINSSGGEGSVPLETKEYNNRVVIKDHLAEVTKLMVLVGRIQIMRVMIAHELRSFCKLNSGSLFAALSTVNEALLTDLQHHYHSPDSHPMPGEIINAVSPFLDCAGISDALTKVYVTSKPIPSFVFYLIALTLRNIPRMRYDDKLASMVPSELKYLLDPEALVIALALLLKQFHSDQLVLFLNHLSRVVCAVVRNFYEDSQQQQQQKQKQKKKDSGPQQRLDDILPEDAEKIVHVIHGVAEATGAPTLDLHRMFPAPLSGDFRLPVTKGKG
ncbi:hypothetical protein, conserved [Trypanosoma brucei brucei TREU927]|uniref:WASH complex subunit strumpellin n=1 Tax=Trypanosoma brucei brucei (strain 927/4 GUTat10.1) TaxID=185431 RepID=Q386S7_TRYB2|nr:hypothetical protein, conserved [Trypanosoma brucei brucei TREU927]EAN79204.1 hypothetical protein, conserved [Trypanosoma brucei brucei TREU927]